MEVCEAERLLAGRSKPSSTLASKDWESAVTLSKGQVHPGCFPAVLLGPVGEVLQVCFCYCALEESLGHLATRNNQNYLYLTLPEENTSFSFHFTYLKEFIYLFKCGPCQEEKGCLT